MPRREALLYSIGGGIASDFLLENIDVSFAGNNLLWDRKAPKDIVKSFAAFYNIKNLALVNCHFKVSDEYKEDYKKVLSVDNCENFIEK